MESGLHWAMNRVAVLENEWAYASSFVVSEETWLAETELPKIINLNRVVLYR